MSAILYLLFHKFPLALKEKKDPLQHNNNYLENLFYQI